MTDSASLPFSSFTGYGLKYNFIPFLSDKNIAFIKMDENSYFSVLELGKHGDLDNFVTNLLSVS